MNVLYISNCSALVGGNRSMLELADSLSDMGVNVFFMFPSYGGKEEKRILSFELERKGYQYAFFPYLESVHKRNERDILSLGLKRKQNQDALKKMVKYAHEWEIQLVHSNSIILLVGAMLADKIGVPHIWHIREEIGEAYGLTYDNRLLYKFYLKRAKKVICVSEYIMDRYRKDLWGVNKSTVYDGIDVDKYNIRRGKKSNDIYNILIYGSICENKGQLQAVQALDRIINQEHYTKVYLTIVGTGKGEYLARLKKAIRTGRLERYVNILPFQNDLSELRKIADVTLVCSKSEAFGRVTVESMLGESVVVGARTSGTRELIHDGVTGYLYEYGNVDDLKNKILSVFFHWEKQEKILCNAKAFALKNFNSKFIAKKMLQIYKEF